MKRINRKFKRRLKGKTNYNKRIKLVKSKSPRFVVRRSLNFINVQCIKYAEKGDITVVSVNSRALREKFKWKGHCGNVSAAYLTGLLCAKMAKEKGVTDGILDIGLATPTKGSVVYGVLKGLVDGGVSVPHSKEILPSDAVVSGKLTADFASKLDKDKYNKQFSKCLKNGFKPEDFSKYFEETKVLVTGGK